MHLSLSAPCVVYANGVIQTYWSGFVSLSCSEVGMSR
jgi:hypothetical protein